METCIAIADGDRINLIIKKGDANYRAFAKVLTKIDTRGAMIWYGDIVDETGQERDGLIITSKIELLNKEG